LNCGTKWREIDKCLWQQPCWLVVALWFELDECLLVRIAPSDFFVYLFTCWSCAFVVRSSATRFRLWQKQWTTSNTWAVSSLYVGQQCPDLCHGHGLCVAGQCRSVDYSWQLLSLDDFSFSLMPVKCALIINLWVFRVLQKVKWTNYVGDDKNSAIIVDKVKTAIQIGITTKTKTKTREFYLNRVKL